MSYFPHLERFPRPKKGSPVASNPFKTDVLTKPPVENLEEAVFRSLGAASSCWENLDGAGVFQSDRCKSIGEDLLEYIRTNS